MQRLVDAESVLVHILIRGVYSQALSAGAEHLILLLKRL